MDTPTDMTDPNQGPGLIPVDQPTNNAETADLRRNAKENLWGIDKGIRDGQVTAPPDDGKRLAGGIVIPDGKNTI